MASSRGVVPFAIVRDEKNFVILSRRSLQSAEKTPHLAIGDKGRKEGIKQAMNASAIEQVSRTSK
jgi:hypothetical protein